MSVDLQAQIRRYTEAMDSMAPIVEDLIPEQMTEGLDDVLRPVVDVTVPQFGQPRRRIPGWLVGLAVAVGVTLLAVPVALWLNQDLADVAVTTPVPAVPITSTAVVTTAAVQQGAFAPTVGLDLPQGNLHGFDFPALATVKVSTDGEATWDDVGNTDEEGAFDLVGYSPAAAGQKVSVEVAGTVVSVVVPFVSLVELDASANTINGETNLAPGSDLTIFLFTDPEDRQAEEFSLEISSDGTWTADVDGMFDVTNQTRVDLVYGSGGIWVSWTHEYLLAESG